MFGNRTKLFLAGIAVALAFSVGIATKAFAARGGPFFMGTENTSSTITTLVKRGMGSALSLVVTDGEPPLRVNGTIRLRSDGRYEGREAPETVPPGEKPRSFYGKSEREVAKKLRQARRRCLPGGGRQRL